MASHKLGSGVAIRWDEKTVVLTAAHVARGCKQVLVYLATAKRWAAAATVKLDDRWDVAILTLALADAAKLEPADIAWGEDATPKQGERLESCGLGPDGRLAVNSGVLLGYRSNGGEVGGRWNMLGGDPTCHLPPTTYRVPPTTYHLPRPAEWFDVSGPARQGDSGGPVFDAKGQVVGILWGTDDRTVTATQGGYLHRLLADSLGAWDGGGNDQGTMANGQSPKANGQSPKTASVEPWPLNLGPSPAEACAGKLFPRLGQPKTPAPSPPQVIVNTDPEVRKDLRQIEGTMGQVAVNTTPKPEPQASEGVPAWAKILCIIAALMVGAFVFYVVQQN
jgi:hypothetical protein